jgi:hypothetical protein
MPKYDRVDLAEMEAVYAGYDLGLATEKLEAIRKGMTYEEQVKFAQAELELAEIRSCLVDVRMGFEVLARDRPRPLPRSDVVAIEKEIHASMVKLRAKLGRA